MAFPGLDDKQKRILVRRGHITLNEVIPEFVSSGTYTVGLSSNGYRTKGYPSNLHILNSRSSGLPIVQVREHLGRKSIFIDDEPQPWIERNSLRMRPGDTGLFAEAGADFIIDTSVGVGTTMLDEPTWTGVGASDFSSLDQRVAMILAAKPDARIIVNPNLALPPLWTQNNPGHHR